MADKGLIIVPKPGELLGMLGAGGALVDAIKSASRDELMRTKLRGGLLNGPSPFTKVDSEWLTHDALDAQPRSYAQFKKEYLGNFPPDGEPIVPVVAGQESASAKDKFFGVDWSSAAIAGSITKKHLQDALAHMASQSLKTEPLLGPKSMWDEMREEEENVVDVVFWYYRDTSLVYSIRRVADNFFYDFATKTFKMLPVHPRAGMPKAEPTKPSGYIYSTRLSGQLDDGEYVVTIRDSKADDVVVGITALFMQDGAQKQTPPQGLENTPIEEGIPTPDGTFRRAQRRVRPVDTGSLE